MTEYGLCIRFKQAKPKEDTPNESDGHVHGSEWTTNELDITLAFNLSDWTAGYFGEIGGFIAYFSAPGQVTELRDTKTRVVLSGGQSTRVTLRTLHLNKLEHPLGYHFNSLFQIKHIFVFSTCHGRPLVATPYFDRRVITIHLSNFMTHSFLEQTSLARFDRVVCISVSK